MSDTPKYASSLYFIGGTSGYEIMPGSRWTPNPEKAGEMVADPHGFYVNNLVLREANRRISALHGERGGYISKITDLEEECDSLRRAVAAQPLIVQALYERLKADPHATDLFKLVKGMATLMNLEAA